MPESARLFPHGCVASPDRAATAAGAEVLARGGNAVDAAVAANLVLAVVTPYYCGVGGDLFAIVWDGRATGIDSAGAAPGGATPDAIRAAVAAGHGAGAPLAWAAGMPRFGALTVTVPGAVAGWFHLLERFGSRSFGALAAPAVALARDGVPLSTRAARAFERGVERYAEVAGWGAAFGDVVARGVLVQPQLARALERVAADGADAVYRGPMGAAMVEALQAGGSTMTTADLAAHEVREVEPLTARFRDVDVMELPPPTQGTTALTAVAVADALGAARDPALRAHLHIEAVRAALADRQRYLTDPAHMTTDPAALFAPDRTKAIAATIDPERAAAWPPATPAPGGTAYLCAADRDGRLVSLIQSNYMGFGSGVVVPGWGVGLHNRGAHFSLDPDHVNVVAPAKRTLHTLAPALALRDGRPWLVFGTMGGDGQPQTHLQVLSHRRDDDVDVQAAIAAPRWVVDPADGRVTAESRLPAEVVAGLRRRGHDVTLAGAYDDALGHAHAIETVPGGYLAASDPRCDGAVLGH